MPHINVGVRMLALLVVMSGSAEARPLNVRTSYPVAEMILDGRNAQYIVRFDVLIDHAAAGLDITANGKIVATLVPTGDSEPDVLAASTPVLAPGRYQLHWRVKSSPEGGSLGRTHSFHGGPMISAAFGKITVLASRR